MKKRKDIPLPIIILAFMVFWPAGVILLLMNITNGGDGKSINKYRKQTYSQNGYKFDKDVQDVPYSSSDDEVGAKFNFEDSRNGIYSMRKGRKIRGIGMAMTIAGMILSGISFASNLMDYYFVSEALLIASEIFLAIGGPGIALTVWGNNTLEKARLYRRYSQIIGNSPEISIERLAGALNLPYKKVCDDINKMIDRGGFDGYYIDNARKVLTSEHLSAVRVETPEKEREMSPADQIRFINGKVIQPEVSKKMLQLETLTRRIYAYTESHPQKEKFAANFKQRYLPMTIKILEAYSNFESSGSGGENVTAAMKETEAVLDTLISSFEKQLDMLYMDEAIDITTDIEVLERMMHGDGLGDSPFGGMQQQQ